MLFDVYDSEQKRLPILSLMATTINDLSLRQITILWGEMPKYEQEFVAPWSIKIWDVLQDCATGSAHVLELLKVFVSLMWGNVSTTVDQDI